MSDSALPGSVAPAVARQPVGPGRVLAVVYGFFTLAAGARSGVQLSTHPRQALLAYVLSAVAAMIYAAGTVVVALADRSPCFHRWAVLTCTAEIGGVLAVGTLSLLRPHDFPDATVWSAYGLGYVFVPAVLPMIALLWLHFSLSAGADARSPHPPLSR